MRNLYLISLFVIFISCSRKTALEYYNLGMESNSLGKSNKAFKYYSLAIKTSPDNPEYYFRRAEARLNMMPSENKEKMILEDLNNAIRIKPWYYDAVILKAKYLVYTVDSKKAIEDLDSLIKRYPKEVEAYKLLSEIYMRDGDTAMAYINYSKLLKLHNNKNEVYSMMASQEFIYGFYRQSINHYKNVLNSGDSLSFSKYKILSMAYWKLNLKDSACYYYRNDKEPELMQDYKELRVYCNIKE